MKCIRQNDVEISKKIMDKYDLETPQGRLDYILKEKEGFFPLFSNSIYSAMGGKTEYNKVKEIMCKDMDEFLNIADLKIENIDIEAVSKARVYSLDGIFTTLISFVEMSKVLRLMRKDVDKLEAGFEKIERDFILFLETLNLNGVRHFSYADPSAMPEILGRYHQKWIVERFMKLLDKLSHLDIVIHICPVLFNDIKKMQNMENYPVESYQDEFLSEKGFKVVGGSCIKNKNEGVYFYF
ncbi:MULTISPECIES: hypothetical protein [Psychrilyobacter]|uniref:Uroporphyrinogen decarboxylase (URO-D) domain-containing protein n=1 Tax=Psychrilyobacter piezotolerans TaxID=2293438 RepID=A0ABX9KFK7_9FUSO|nr:MULTISPECIES: hypothetical protein [Psychrilyobacter]MCS5422505.1 hypothetical protein [Psychrilyobacter sp. S5]NDI78617.1 hypothetical protein [Psychrilyobacter piezotolerans]RDE60319.1 hypothetical protein DV867_11245 [Psychrilyobacter sp. S5]REI40427.1 hypothetical protein DYH56_11245 [Psychrilyobacter piezotolerans]